MKEVEIKVRNETGLHSRPADLFVRTAKLYKSKITVIKGDKKADAKNIIRTILLNVAQDDEILITSNGEDEDAAIEDLKRLIESDFTEVNEKIKV